jgi:hypothetical protein
MIDLMHIWNENGEECVLPDDDLSRELKALNDMDFDLSTAEGRYFAHIREVVARHEEKRQS